MVNPYDGQIGQTSGRAKSCCDLYSQKTTEQIRDADQELGPTCESLQDCIQDLKAAFLELQPARSDSEAFDNSQRRNLIGAKDTDPLQQAKGINQLRERSCGLEGGATAVQDDGSERSALNARCRDVVEPNPQPDDSLEAVELSRSLPGSSLTVEYQLQIMTEQNKQLRQRNQYFSSALKLEEKKQKDQKTAFEQHFKILLRERDYYREQASKSGGQLNDQEFQDETDVRQHQRVRAGSRSRDGDAEIAEQPSVFDDRSESRPRLTPRSHDRLIHNKKFPRRGVYEVSATGGRDELDATREHSLQHSATEQEHRINSSASVTRTTASRNLRRIPVVASLNEQNNSCVHATNDLNDNADATYELSESDNSPMSSAIARRRPRANSMASSADAVSEIVRSKRHRTGDETSVLDRRSSVLTSGGHQEFDLIGGDSADGQMSQVQSFTEDNINAGAHRVPIPVSFEKVADGVRMAVFNLKDLRLDEEDVKFDWRPLHATVGTELAELLKKRKDKHEDPGKRRNCVHVRADKCVNSKRRNLHVARGICQERRRICVVVFPDTNRVELQPIRSMRTTQYTVSDIAYWKKA